MAGAGVIAVSQASAWITFAPDIAAGAARRAEAALRAINLPVLASGCLVRRLAGGASNENFLVTAADGQRLVLRLTAGVALTGRFGLDRWRGLDAHKVAEAAGIAPRMVGITLPDGHSLVEFVDQPVVDEARIREPGILEACTSALRRVHIAGVVRGHFSALTEVHRFLRIANAEKLPLPGDISQLVTASEAIEEIFYQVGVPQRLCHNDVQLANFLTDGQVTWVLDWEYAAMGNPYFDLAMIAGNADLGDQGAVYLLDCYWGKSRRADLARLNLQRFQAALREAMWSVIAKSVLADTGWDYDAWADRFFGKARAVSASVGFQEYLDQARPQPAEARFFTDGTDA